MTSVKSLSPNAAISKEPGVRIPKHLFWGHTIQLLKIFKNRTKQGPKTTHFEDEMKRIQCLSRLGTEEAGRVIFFGESQLVTWQWWGHNQIQENSIRIAGKGKQGNHFKLLNVIKLINGLWGVRNKQGSYVQICTVQNVSNGKNAAEKNGAGEGTGSTKARQESPFAIGSQQQAVLSAGHQSKRVFRKC